MKQGKPIFDRFLDVLEIKIPSLLLVLMFVAFLLQIIIRYCFSVSLAFINELSIITFTWLPLMAAPYGSRTDTHINFTVVYDLLNKKAKLWFDVLSNVFIAFSFLVLLGPSIETIKFYGIKKTSIMKMSFSILYMPFALFLMLTIYHALNNLVGVAKKYRAQKNKNKKGI